MTRRQRFVLEAALKIDAVPASEYAADAPVLSIGDALVLMDAARAGELDVLPDGSGFTRAGGITKKNGQRYWSNADLAKLIARV